MTGKDKLLEKALAAFKKNDYTGVALIPTGAGKGRLMIEIAKLLPKTGRILYLCNTELLRDKTFIDELHKWDAKYLLDRMDLCCYQTAYKFVGREYLAVLADEFDASLTDEYEKVYKNNSFTYKILVSATLDEAKKRRAKKIAPIIFEVKPKTLIEENVLNNVKFHYVRYNLSPEENKVYLDYNEKFKNLLNAPKTFKTNKDLDFLKIQRKQFLSKTKTSVEVTKWLVEHLSKKQEKILIFCGLSEQADKVCQHSYHSNNDAIHNFEAFEQGLINVLSVVDKVDRGLNIAQIRHIIFASLGSSKSKLTQRVGRGMRLEVHETLQVFFPIPFFKNKRGELTPTIVEKWMLDAAKDMDLSKMQYINFNT